MRDQTAPRPGAVFFSKRDSFWAFGLDDNITRITLLPIVTIVSTTVSTEEFETLSSTKKAKKARKTNKVVFLHDGTLFWSFRDEFEKWFSADSSTYERIETS